MALQQVASTSISCISVDSHESSSTINNAMDGRYYVLHLGGYGKSVANL
jgi:hypothetical protein